jgi:ferric-dicitrate binding protein FerR (iron transport regulator)
VSDVGTVFQVDVKPTAVRVRVREGLVQLDAAGREGLLRSGAGEELELDERGGLRHGIVPPSHPAWAWAEALAPPPDVEGRPLLQFLDWVAHETGRRVRFAAPEVEAQAREVVLHGRTRDLTPLQALDVMLSTTDLEYVLSTDQVILIRRRSG